MNNNYDLLLQTIRRKARNRHRWLPGCVYPQNYWVSKSKLTTSLGIGAAVTKRLAAKGCNLLLIYTSDSSKSLTEGIAAELSAAHSIRVSHVQADLNEPATATPKIVDAAKAFYKSYHPDRELQIDILINNAGVSEDRNLNDPKGAIKPEHFHWQYTINVLAPLLLTQAIAPYLPNDRTGRIVNISSVSSTLSFVGQSIYGGTKAALESMTRTWARELADKATVNAINPGPVIGDMYFKAGEAFWRDLQGFVDNAPLSKMDLNNKDVTSRLTEEQIRLINEKMGGRRPAFTSEIAGAVGMLCTPDGAWTTGSVVNANGGMKMVE